MTNEYVVPKVWSMKTSNDGANTNATSSLNRPDSGARFERELPSGTHPLQLYSLATPNGIKITILLEELLLLGVSGAEYDAHIIRINKGEQFSSGFVEINPNSKIPALVDKSTDPSINLFESGHIMLYLAEKFGHFLPKNAAKRAETLNWFFWLHGSAPYVGNFGHFFLYAPEKLEYPIDRFTMETKRQLDVLEKLLSKRKFIIGDEYTIADIAIWSWYGAIALNKFYNAAEFLDTKGYPNFIRWVDEIAGRPAVKRGIIVNKSWGDVSEQLPERHSAAEIDAVLAKAQ